MKVRFLCEECGKEVPFNVEVCPSCGRQFKAVKCPICELEGSPDLFSEGCPACGYMSSAKSPVRTAPTSPGVEDTLSKPEESAEKTAGKAAEKSAAGGAFSYRGRGGIKKPNPPKPRPAPVKKNHRLLPNWILGWGTLLLLLLLVVLLVVFLRS